MEERRRIAPEFWVALTALALTVSSGFLYAGKVDERQSDQDRRTEKLERRVDDNYNRTDQKLQHISDKLDEIRDRLGRGPK